MLTALMDFGYINQDSENFKYSLTLKFAKIGAIVSSRNNLREISHSKLVELSKKCNEAACIAIEEDNQVVYTDVADGPDGILKVMHYIGKQAPMHCTGVGKCILLNYNESQIDMLIEKKGLQQYTSNTITTKEALMKELELVLERGYAFDNQECEMGARCVASGIRDYSGKIIAAISVSGPAIRVTPEYLASISELVVKVAREISASLSYTG
jgi:DNA-binding IclR family transcriptional regulator